MTIKILQTRKHNERALNINIHGGDAKYKNPDQEKMIRAVEAMQNG